MSESGVIDVFVLNQNGVKIKKCCASCAHHEAYDDDGPRRRCIFDPLQNKIVNKIDLCKHWAISDNINRIKIG